MKRSKAASISTSSQARSLLPDYPWGERLKLPDDGCYVRTTTVEKLKHPESDYLNNQKLAKLQLLENMTTFLRAPHVEKRGFGQKGLRLRVWIAALFGGLQCGPLRPRSGRDRKGGTLSLALNS